MTEEKQLFGIWVAGWPTAAFGEDYTKGYHGR